MHKKDNEPYKPFDTFKKLFEQAEKREGYWEERAKLEFTRDVVERMKQLDLSKSALAAKLEVRPGMVTRLLSGRNNFEISTMVRMARAVNCRFRSHLQPDGTKSHWIDVLHNEPKRKVVEPWNPDSCSVERELFYPKILNYEPLAVAA